MTHPSPQRKFTSRFRRNFATGLLVLAPAFITIYLVTLVVHFLGGFISPFLRDAAIYLLGENQWPRLILLISDVVGFLITVVIIAFVGALVRRVVGKRLLGLVNRALSRIPVIREVYDGITKFLQLLFGDKSGFQHVVAVRFPNEHTWSIGFVTNSRDWPGEDGTLKLHHVVFVPHTPNASSGFTVFAQPEHTIRLDLTVDEALKIIISGGTLSEKTKTA